MEGSCVLSNPCLGDALTLVAALPLPHRNCLVRRIVDGGQHRSAVGPTERQTVDRSGKVAVADHDERGQRHGVPDTDVRLNAKEILYLDSKHT